MHLSVFIPALVNLSGSPFNELKSPSFGIRSVTRRRLSQSLSIFLSVKIQDSSIFLLSAERRKIELSCIFTERKIERDCDSLLLVTERIPNDGLFNSLNGDPERLTNAGIKTLKCIGDSFAPATIAAAVYSGHLAARELQAEPQEEVPFLRERIQI